MASRGVVGVALQKSYISVYLSVAKNGVPLLQAYSGKLGELRGGRNNFSFEKYEDLVTPVLSSLFAEAEKMFRASLDDPMIEPREYVHKDVVPIRNNDQLSLSTRSSRGVYARAVGRRLFIQGTY